MILHAVLLDLFKLVQAGGLGGVLEGDFDFLLVGAGLDDFGFFLDPTDLVNILLVLAVGGGFLEVHNNRALPCHLTDATDPAGCLLCRRHGGLAPEHTSQTILPLVSILGNRNPNHRKCP